MSDNSRNANRWDERGDARLGIAFGGGVLLLAPAYPGFQNGEISLIDMAMRFFIAFVFVGAIATFIAYIYSLPPAQHKPRAPLALPPGPQQEPDTPMNRRATDIEDIDFEDDPFAGYNDESV